MLDRFARYQGPRFDHPVKRGQRIGFNRPEIINYLDAGKYTSLTDVWTDADCGPDISAVVAPDAGWAFSAAGDFEMVEQMTDNSLLEKRAPTLHRECPI